MNYPPTEMTQLCFELFLAVLLVGTIGDLFIPVIIGFKYPGYSHLYHTISSLGTNVSPVKISQCINLVIVGLLLIVFSFGQYRLFHSINWANRLYFSGIIVFGIGCVIAGFYPEDPIGVDETVSGKIHGIASGIGFLFLILNPLWAIWIKEFQVIRSYHILTLFFALLTFILFIISEGKDYGIFKYTGLLQRLNLLIIYGHMIICFITSHKYEKPVTSIYKNITSALN